MYVSTLPVPTCMYECPNIMHAPTRDQSDIAVGKQMVAVLAIIHSHKHNNIV